MQAIGIHIDGAILRRALIRREGKNFLVKGVQTITDGVKPFYTETLSTPLVSGLSSRDVLLQILPFSARKSQKLRQALKMQSSAQLHLKEEELISALLFDDKVASIYSTTQHALSSHLEAFQPFGQDPDRVTSIPEALKAFMRWKVPELRSYLLVDLGFVTTNFLWVEEGSVRSAHALSFGVKDLDDSTRGELFCSEFSRILTAFPSTCPLILTGEDCEGSLKELLKSSGWEERQIGLSGDEQHYAISIGLALDDLTNRKEPLQFRQGAALSRRSLHLFGRNGALLLLVSLLCSLGSVLGGTYWVAIREKELVRQLDAKIGSDLALRKELRINGIDARSLVNQWMGLIKRNAREYPFLNRSYRVSEVLDWLMHLTEGSLEQFHYQLVSFPRLEGLQEPYLVKVEAELKIEDPVSAHQLHEQLKQGNGMCDASREITWELFSDRIRTSFYLNCREPCLI